MSILFQTFSSSSNLRHPPDNPGLPCIITVCSAWSLIVHLPQGMSPSIEIWVLPFVLWWFNLRLTTNGLESRLVLIQAFVQMKANSFLNLLAFDLYFLLSCLLMGLDFEFESMLSIVSVVFADSEDRIAMFRFRLQVAKWGEERKSFLIRKTPISKR